MPGERAPKPEKRTASVVSLSAFRKSGEIVDVHPTTVANDNGMESASERIQQLEREQLGMLWGKIHQIGLDNEQQYADGVASARLLVSQFNREQLIAAFKKALSLQDVDLRLRLPYYYVVGELLDIGGYFKGH